MTDSSVWRERGTPLVPPLSAGALNGVTVAVKDLFAIEGFPIGAGNPAWLADAPVESTDAWAVHTLRTAGAAIAGIARTDELAFSLSGTNAHYGTPPNLAAPDRVTGGSSSGPASAVASGQADVGLGSDTAGSIRVPASACGLFGLRPTHGAVSVDGLLALARSFDTVGWLTRDARLLRVVGEVLLRASGSASPARLLCLIPNDRIRRLADDLGSNLHTGPIAGLGDFEALLSAFRLLQAGEAWREHGAWITAHPGALAPDVEARFRFGEHVDARERAKAKVQIARRRADLLDVLTDRTWLVFPMGAGHLRGADPGAKDAWRLATLHTTVVASAFGLPSSVLPQPAEPPAGLALVGPPGADRGLLDAAVHVGREGVSP